VQKEIMQEEKQRNGNADRVVHQKPVVAENRESLDYSRLC